MRAGSGSHDHFAQVLSGGGPPQPTRANGDGKCGHHLLDRPAGTRAMSAKGVLTSIHRSAWCEVMRVSA
jgi:hypothetical protein